MAWQEKVFEALLTFGVQALTSGVNYGLNQSQQKQNAARENFTYLRERSDKINDWYMKNVHDAPEAQMQRYKDAGLNPNLIYGSSGDNSSAALDATHIDPAAAAPTQIDLSSVMSTYMQAMAQRSNDAFRDRALRLQEDRFAYQQSTDLMFNPYKLTRMDLENVGLGMDNKDKELELEYKQEDRPYQFTIMANKAAESFSALQLAQENVELAKKQGKLTDAQTRLVFAQQRKTSQEIRNLQASQQLTEAQTNKLNSEVRFLNETFFDRKQVLKFDGKMASLDYNMLFEKSMGHKETLDLETRLLKVKASLAEFAEENKELFQYGKFFMDIVDTGLDVIKPSKK